MKRKGCFSISLVLLLFTAIAISAMSCNSTGQESNGETIGIIVTLPPQVEFVENVGGEQVDVTVMVPPGADPHIYEPTPSQMVAVSEAEMYIMVGTGIEFEMVWLDSIIAQNDDLFVVDCSDGISLIEMGVHNEHEDEEHMHDNEGMDPHIWMSPQNAMIMVSNICNWLILVDMDNASYYEANRDAYLEELAQLDQDIEEDLAHVTNRVFMVYHPSFGYFAHEYDLTMLPIEEEGKEPTAAGLAHLINQAQERDIKVIFAESQFNPKSAQTIADQIGGRIVLIDPLAKDYIGNLRLILSEIVAAME